MRELTGVLVDVQRQIIEEVVIESENILEELYKILNCDTIDIVQRFIGDKFYDVIVDDEGLFKEEVIPSVVAMSENNSGHLLVGNALILNNDGQGNLISLTPEEIQEVLSSQGTAVDSVTEEEYKILITKMGVMYG